MRQRQKRAIYHGKRDLFPIVPHAHLDIAEVCVSVTRGLLIIKCESVKRGLPSVKRGLLMSICGLCIH